MRLRPLAMLRSRGRIRLAAAGSVVLGACVLLGCEQSDDVIARAVSTSSSGSDCTQACGTPGCPCPPKPRVPIIAPDGTEFAIDATERTLREYEAFLASHRGRPGASAGDVCAWNESYVPADTSLDLDPRCRTDFDYRGFLAESPERPVACVDWCDARDYCAWAGGRLCGRTTGGELTPELRASAEDEWFVACSGGGSRIYAYGDAFDPTACNTRDSDNGVRSVPIGSLPRCEGARPGLFDMNGNANEWIATCAPSAPGEQARATCFRVGGAFYQGAPFESRCDSAEPGLRSTTGNDTGFRCCYDR